MNDLLVRLFGPLLGSVARLRAGGGVVGRILWGSVLVGALGTVVSVAAIWKGASSWQALLAALVFLTVLTFGAFGMVAWMLARHGPMASLDEIAFLNYRQQDLAAAGVSAPPKLSPLGRDPDVPALTPDGESEVVEKDQPEPAEENPTDEDAT